MSVPCFFPGSKKATSRIGDESLLINSRQRAVNEHFHRIRLASGHRRGLLAALLLQHLDLVLHDLDQLLKVLPLLHRDLSTEDIYRYEIC
jgi:hypothetical protein